MEKISLLGYSLGGRICTTIIQLMPSSIDRVTLLATDGLTVNFYYFFFTRTYVGKKLFRKMLQKPTTWFKILDWLRNRNFVDASSHKFVMQSLASEANRKLLSQVWPTLSDLIPKPEKLKATIKKYQIPITIFMGAYDKIMPPKLGEKFKTRLNTIQLYILEKGHRIFDDDNTESIARSLL